MNIQHLKQLREAREKATQGEWNEEYIYWILRYGRKNDVVDTSSEAVGAEIDESDAEYITLLHNNAEELIRMAEAGQALAEAVKNFPDDPPHKLGEREYCIECSQRIKKKMLRTYNKTVSK